MIFTVKDIADILKATFVGSRPTSVVNHISIDSRSLINDANSMFFALAGKNANGHDYIEELYKNGVRNFVVTKASNLPEANFLIVEDTLVTLQKFAAYYRSLFTFPIIGITGSNGKTIVKEWLNFLLSPDHNIIRSPKSYNSQVGVPLSVLGINEKHNFGIFEAGISTVSEMRNLAKIIKPTIGVLTNIGSAHNEGFENTTQKINEKVLLFADADILICKKDDISSIQLSSNYKLLTWSFTDATADILVQKLHVGASSRLSIKQAESTFTVELPFTDYASLENAMHCVIVMIYLRYDQKSIQNRVALLYPIQMRLQLKNGISNTTIIDDSYSSDYQSLKIALDFLESQKQHDNKTVILSDIFQSGLSEDELYSNVQQLLVSNKIDRVFVIGNRIVNYARGFPNCEAYNSTQEFISNLPMIDFSHETILIKGARHYKFEEIVTLLEEKTHETVLEINLNAISHNLNYFRSFLKPATKLMVMVKAFGYGSGGFEIAKLLEHHNVDYLGVAFADEGISLKNSGIKVPIMVLNPESTSYGAIIQHQLEPEIYSFTGLQSFINLARKHQVTNYPIHLKLDTGMHRLGFQEADLLRLIPMLRETNCIKIQSILSHLATSDEQDNTFAEQQIALFDRLSQHIIDELQIQPLRHILNSSGIAKFPQAEYEMVRLGIGLYSDMENSELQKVSTLKSVISQIRTIPAGDSVGYGRHFVASKPAKIATIPIGYADGISRHWGKGKGFVTIHDKKAVIVGSVCMDMLMVDVTDISCTEGDTVTIFGQSPTIEEMAKTLETIPYEVLTSISQRVKRIYYRE